MDRRDFLGTTGAAAAGLAISTVPTVANDEGLSAPAIMSLAARVEPLLLGVSYPMGASPMGDRCQRFIHRLATATEGRICLQPQVLDGTGMEALAMGQIDAYISPEPQALKQHGGFAYFGGLPGNEGMTAEVHLAWLLVGGGQVLWDHLGSEFNVKPLLIGHTGRSAGLWLNQRLVEDAVDFRRQRLSVWGLSANVAQALGAETRDVAAHDLAGALTDQRLTGAEWGDLAGDVALRLHRAASHLLTPGVTQHGTALTLGVRLQLWERFSVSDRTIIEACAAEAYQHAKAEQIAMEPVAQQVLRVHSGEVQEFEHRSITRAINRTSQDVIMEHGKTDPLTGRIHDSYYAFKATAPSYAQIVHNNTGV